MHPYPFTLGSATLPGVLDTRARRQADQLAFRFLEDGTTDSAVDWTYRDLAERAASVASHLRERDLVGRRVMLVANPGLDFIAALFGIFAAGAVAVPSFPPVGKRGVPRFVSIYRDCQPDMVIAEDDFTFSSGQFDQGIAAELASRWIAIDALMINPSSTEVTLIDDRIDLGAHPALLQYTSGSTGDPKGVVISHDNLVSNSLTLEANMGHDPDRVGCSWLPPYHDMGLIGTIVLAVFSGWPLVTMSPVHFVQHPYRWLKAISDHRVTISVTPNFAMELATATVTDEELAGLDLSSLRQVYCGSEPVRSATLDEFRDRFAPAGYDEAAMIPCYGMAEATLFISGKPDGTGVRLTRIGREALEQGRAEVVPDDAEAPEGDVTDVVSCGVVAVDHDVRVVDPEARVTLADGLVGEVWVAGPSVAAGYFQRPEVSAEAFGVPRADAPDGPGYLRTGDLGFMLDGELYITGRRKDLIIIGGRNLYPQDIEASVSNGCADVWSVAAFAEADDDGGEALVVVAELLRGVEPTVADVDRIQADVVGVVNAEHGVAPADVYVGPAGTIRQTTSGKVQRNATRQAYRRGELRTLVLSEPAAPAEPATAPGTQQADELQGAALPAR